MTTYSFDEFKNNIINITNSKNTYFWEVMLTDFYCFQKDINPEKIYISKPVADGGIDAIVIPKNSSDIAVNTISVLQISTQCKSLKDIEDFLNIDPYDLQEYKKLLDDYADEKKYRIHKVLITFNHNNTYSKFNTLEIISGDKLFESIFESSIRYKLIYNKNTLKQEYIDNVNKRVLMWTELHRFKKYDQSIINSFIYFILLNYNSIKIGEFNLVSDLDSIWKSSFKDTISTLKFFNSNDRDKLIESDDDTCFILMTIFRYGNNLNSDIFNLVKRINLLKKNNSSLEKIVINPTIDYLSIYYNDNPIAYLQYVYNKKPTSEIKFVKSRFSFKCNFNELYDNKHFLPPIIKKYIDDKRLVSTKEENKNNTGATHTGMSTSLVLPSEDDDDWSVVSFLLHKSINIVHQK